MSAQVRISRLTLEECGQSQANNSIVHEANEQDVNDAVAAAKTAFPAWSDMDPRERGQYLHKMADLIRESTSELAYLETISTGRPISHYFDAAIAADNFDYYAEAGWNAQGTSSLNTRGHLNLTVKQPFGVVGAIIPWNVPLAAFTFKVAPALAAGNTVVLKSSEKAPLTVSSVMLEEPGLRYILLTWRLSSVDSLSTRQS
jgi:aldehyde dehydrogenase (NAD+)